MSLSGGGFTLLHEDASLLVLDKPAGLLCVPGRGPDKQDALSTRVQANFPDALIVHRLDMATSGLVLMARGITNQRRLSAAFEAREVDKRYLAWVAGDLTSLAHNNSDGSSKWQTINLPIGPDWPNRPRQQVDLERGKPSLTHWRCAPATAGANPHETGRTVATFANATRIELEPLTGRTHQLRVHMAAIGHPMLGDALYAMGEAPARVDRLMLHAARLAFAHPATGERLQFSSPAPF